MERVALADAPSPVVESARPRGPSASGRVQDPEGVRRNILDVARAEFVEKGLSGARIDAIAARTSTSKRMIYYYFGDKEGLYRAVLEESYRQIRALERTLDLAALSPVQALAELAGFTFDYHADHPDFVRLVMVENIHHARHLRMSPNIGALNLSAIEMIRDVYARGVAAGVFRAGLDPIDIHLTITAPSFYNVSNRATIEQIFGHRMDDSSTRARRRAGVVEMALRFVAP